MNPVNFWKPVKSNRKTKSNSIKPISFINLSKYPTRSKTELNLINRKPFGDKDKDKLMNWFDCKPLDKKKQAFLHRVKKRKGAGKYQPQVQRIYDRMLPGFLRGQEKMKELERFKGKTYLRKFKQVQREIDPENTGFFDFGSVPGVKLPPGFKASWNKRPMHLVVEKGVVKGSVVTIPRGNRTTEIKTLYILPEHRKKGLGRKVVKSILTNPQTKKIVAVSIPDAKKFWQNLGSKRGGPEEQEALKEYRQEAMRGIQEELGDVEYEDLPEDMQNVIGGDVHEVTIDKEDLIRTPPLSASALKRTTEDYLETKGPYTESTVQGIITSGTDVELINKPLRQAGRFRDLMQEGKVVRIKNRSGEVVRTLRNKNGRIEISTPTDETIFVDPNDEISYEEWKGLGTGITDRGSYVFKGRENLPPGLRGKTLKIATEEDEIEVEVPPSLKERYKEFASQPPEIEPERPEVLAQEYYEPTAEELINEEYKDE